MPYSAISLRGVRTLCGEREVSAAELAALQGVSLAAVEHSLADTRLYVTDTDSSLELGEKAGRLCLERSGVAATDIDGIVCFANRFSVFSPTQYLQDKLGATNASVSYSLEGNCTLAVGAVRVARALLVDAPELRRILVIGARSRVGISPIQPAKELTEDHYAHIFSDAACATLVERGPGLAVLGFGAASEGALWNHLRTYNAGTAEARQKLPSEFQVIHGSRALHRLALQRCLDSAGIGIEQIDHVLFSREPAAAVERVLMKQMNLDPDRLFRRAGWPSHTGLSDQWIALEALLAGPGQPGQHVLMVARTYGVMCCMLLRLPPGEPPQLASRPIETGSV